MEERLGPLIIDLEGLTVTPEEAELLKHPLIGGIVLFSRNYHNRSQLSDLCEQIRNNSLKPLVIMVDQEGGRVQRFKSEFTLLPPMAVLGKMYDLSSDTALRAAKDCGWLMATELLSVGVDLSLAPVLDLDRKLNTAIGDRALHSNPQIVAALAQAYTSGMQEAGMSCVAKHFPGHGGVKLDSHVTTPFDERRFMEIKDDLLPFTSLIETGVPAIMTSHIVFPHIDESMVTYSEMWLSTILRQQLNFQGVIISDDLNMQGASITGNYLDRFEMARKAGCDLILLCNNRQAVIQILDNIPHQSHSIDRRKWQLLRGKIRHQHDSSDNIRLNKTRNFLHTSQLLTKT